MPKWGCSVCLKSFKRKGDFTRHTLIHEGNPAHRCEICGKTFYQFSGLRTHWNVHTGAKPFKCGVGLCRKEFGDPSSCSRHRKEIHSGGIMYRCPFNGCNTSIKRRSAFATHIRSKHPGWRINENLDSFTVIASSGRGSDLSTSAVSADLLRDVFGNTENTTPAAATLEPATSDPLQLYAPSPLPSPPTSSIACPAPTFDIYSDCSPSPSPSGSSVPSPSPHFNAQIVGFDDTFRSMECEYFQPASFPSVPYDWPSASPIADLPDALAPSCDWSPDMFPYKFYSPRWPI